MLSINILHPSSFDTQSQPCELFKGTTEMVDSASGRQQLGKRLGRRIAEHRKAIDWTQDQLAERLNVDAETISRFERGVTLPSLVTLDSLAAVLKTSAADLLSMASVAPSDQAIQISAWLACLSEKDSEFVMDQIKRLCNHLQH